MTTKAGLLSPTRAASGPAGHLQGQGHMSMNKSTHWDKHKLSRISPPQLHHLPASHDIRRTVQPCFHANPSYKGILVDLAGTPREPGVLGRVLMAR